jgi:type VI secretion system protein ImpH
MRAPQRQPGAGVIQRLLDEPYHFEFFQAVRLIELWLREHGLLDERGLASLVRFENTTSLRFAPSDIEAIRTRGQDAAVLLALLKQGRTDVIRITPAFMGLLGASGSLPLHYSEVLVADEQAHPASGARAFFDLLSNRSLALFYEAWAKYRVRHRANAHGRDAYLPLLLSFAGIPAEAPPDPERLDDQVLAHFAAQVGARVVSASVLGGVLSTYFGVRVEIEQFAGMWDVLSPGLQTQLGANNCGLGAGATAGRRLWRCDLSYRVRLGPMSRRQFEKFMPGSDGARALARMLAEFSTSLPYCEVQLLLRAGEVRGARLDGQARLGLHSFVTAGERNDRGDIRYRLAPRARL